METSQQIKSYTRQRVADMAAVISSGLCWYFGNGLNGDFWYLVWLAPVPILVLSFRNTAKMTFIISFVAYLIGRLSWFSYLESVATVVPAIIFTVLLPLIFAGIILLSRSVILKTSLWCSVLAFPVFFTLYEFLMVEFSPDGTAASIAYSQCDFLPLVQIVSVTGITGITFVITLIPSMLALSWHLRKDHKPFAITALISFVLLGATFLFGVSRLRTLPSGPVVQAGLVLLNEKFHNTSPHPDFQKEQIIAEYYSKEIERLAGDGVQVIVLPERAINLDSNLFKVTTEIFESKARQFHVFIVTGYTNYREAHERNSALVFDSQGAIVSSYNKVHMVTGLEDQFTPGHDPVFFKLNTINAGVAICKDLDFPDYIRKYGAGEAALMCIPAWDFIVDDWLHSRMAILRGVENGFSEVRTARQGRLTISDQYGRVPYESNAALGQNISMTGTVSAQHINTLYDRFGDWFGFLDIAAALFFLILLLRRRFPKA
jgi:apolipoprotein N-acyltransferase